MADIFIGYAREDRPRAETLAHILEGQGWSVWWDVVIPAGRTFDEVIDEALETVKCVIVLWSSASVDSRYVRGEAQDADERGILVPVLIERDIRIPRAFRAIHAADLVGWDGSETARSFLRLVDDIARLLGPPPILERAPGRANPDISRREFVRVTSLALGGVAVGACNDRLTAPPEPTARVSAIRGNDLAAMTRDALDGLGGIGQVVHEGESVFIKPNMVTLPWAGSSNRFTSGECAKPDIVIAVAEECLRAGATEVVIGDGSQMPSLDWTHATTLDGSTNLAQEAERLSSRYAGDVRVASLEEDSPEWHEIPSRSSLGTIAVSSLVTRADRVISIPVAKTHAWAQLTLSLKNFVGVTPLLRYGEWREPGYWDRGRVLDHSSTRSIAQIYLDIVAALKPDLAIVDFSYCVEGDGPTTGAGEGQTVDMRSRLGSWLVLASTDLVAADATAARIMSHDVDSITQLRMARDLGLGAMSQDRIEMVGERLDDLRVEWRPARLKNRLARCSFGVPAYAQGPWRRLGHRTA